MDIRNLLLLLSLLTSVTVFAQPNPDFEANPLEVCVGEEIEFTDLSTSSGTIDSWDWNFGDGVPSTDQNPTHSYTNPGQYSITLAVEDENGTVAEVKTNYITVYPLPIPSFDLNIIEGCSLPGEISFSNVTPNTNTSYSWDFGDGQTSTSQNPGNVTYSTSGSYVVTLNVTDNTSGCEDSVQQTVDIFDYTADFSISVSTICMNESVNFSDESSLGTDGWSWNFGDGGTSAQENPSHIYATPGMYTVTLIATNTSNDCSDTYTEQIEVLDLPNPTFDFAPGSGCAPLDVGFTNTSSGSGTFEWDFGDGGTSSQENPGTYTYTSNGTYSVTLTQTGTNGCSNSITQTDIITISSITAEFEASVIEGCEMLDVVFTDLSNSPNSDDPITDWEWNFGNGSTFNGQNPPTQTYSEGIYDVTLTVTTDQGCSETVTLTEYINVGIPPTVDFTWDPIIGCAKSDFDFTNLTTIPVSFDSSELVFQWDFGDEGTSSDVHPTYDYPQDTGYFDVQLIVLFRGCPDTMIHEEAVYIDAPIALFTVPSTYCNPTLPLDVTFDDQAIIGKETDDAEMIWDWGDVSIDTVLPPDLYDNNPGSVTHTYNALGSYTIKQVVHNYTTGCSDSITNTIHISSIEALMTSSTDSLCLGDMATFSDNESNSSHTITSYSYDFGNGSNPSEPSTVDSVEYNYPSAGTYDITLTVTNSVGCQDTEVYEDFVILELPIASISPSANAGCSPLLVSFTNNSSNPSGIPINKSDWTFDDGSTETTTNLSQSTEYTFIGEGLYQTSLEVTDLFGCVSLVDVNTEITKPTVDFDLPSVVCSDELFTATNNSIDYTSSEWFINSSSTATATTNNLNTSLNHQGTASNFSFSDDITLIVTDGNGCKDTLTQSITTSAPYADFDFVFSGANTNTNGDFVCPPVFADLTDQSVSFGNITDWNWGFGDGNFSILQNPSNTYVFADTYSGTLIITDEYGCQDTMVYEDYLTIGGPSAVFEWEEIGGSCNSEYRFIPSELDGVSDIMWVMGNGDTIYSLDEFTYSYENAGTYNPTTVLINDNGCNVPYVIDPITVISNNLNAYFEVNPSSVNLSDPMTIIEMSTGGIGGIVDWFWDIEGDQFNNSGGVFDYLFNASGQVTITLVVTDSLGCQDTYQLDVFVTDILTIPNVLTPNGDGSNDVFVLIENIYRDYTVVILNRWGNVVSDTYVFEDNYLWDGLNKNGQESTEGVYFYKITGVQRDGKDREEHGFVHLVRD